MSMKYRGHMRDHAETETFRDDDFVYKLCS